MEVEVEVNKADEERGAKNIWVDITWTTTTLNKQQTHHACTHNVSFLFFPSVFLDRKSVV